jgi:hypothetical protein
VRSQANRIKVISIALANFGSKRMGAIEETAEIDVLLGYIGKTPEFQAALIQETAGKLVRPT